MNVLNKNKLKDLNESPKLSFFKDKIEKNKNFLRIFISLIHDKIKIIQIIFFLKNIQIYFYHLIYIQ